MLQMENDNSSLRTADVMPDLTEIVGTLSHELRTPLATIKGYTATLLRSAQHLSLEEQQEFLQTIAQATERLEIVTARMIDLARLAACRREQSSSHESSETSKHIVQNTGKDTGMNQRLQVSRESETGGRIVWKRSLFPAMPKIRYENV